MKVFLVGGAVRDGLLGRQVTERDYVVVGSTPAARVCLKNTGKNATITVVAKAELAQS